MDGREHAPETVFRAQELYCVERLTYEAVAERISTEIEPVSVSTLKRWGGNFEWRQKRSDIAEALADIPADTILARSKLLKSLLSNPDPQMGFAVSSMESLAMKQAEARRSGKIIEAVTHFELREIRTPEDAVAALEEAAELKFNHMLADPNELNFKEVQDVRKAMKLIAQMKAALRGNDQSQLEKLKEQADKRARELYGI